ncbi:MAG: 50S ribosomal protein L2 [Candidatus Nealsonbacteria bacterium]
MLKKNTTKEDFSLLSKKAPEKGLLLNWVRSSGRGNSGRITSRHRGGGVKKTYRMIDFSQDKLGMPAKVLAFEYDPYRTSFIALLEHNDKEKRYVLAPQGLKVGDSVICEEKTELLPGNRMRLKNISVGAQVYNIEVTPNRGGKMVRGAGTSAQVLAQEGKYTHLKMPSSEIRQILGDCFASVGALSRGEHIYIKLGKAGASRYRGKRPHVRGSAMNPCDHPHGGGNGKTPIGMATPKTPWGKPARGVKTRKRSWTNKYIIQRRQKHGKKS